MKINHDSLLLVASLVCCTMIPLFMWAQEGEVKDTHVLPSGWAMKFERVGGYLGTYSVFWVYPDGQVINALGETGKIPSDIVEQWLKASKTRVGFSGAWKDFSKMPPLCSDCNTYQMTIYDRDGTRTTGFLLTSDGAENTFPGIIRRLRSLSWSPLMGEPEDPDLPKPMPRQPIKVGGSVQKSKLIRKVEPVYPELAKRARVQGRVVLVVTVDEEGNVSAIEVANGHPLLDEAAKATVSQWKYSPTLLNGEPVPVSYTVTLIYSFTESGETAISVGD
jgi:TonB family protein